MLTAHTTLTTPHAPPSMVLALGDMGTSVRPTLPYIPKAKALAFTVAQCRGRPPIFKSSADDDAEPDPPGASWPTPAQPYP